MPSPPPPSYYHRHLPHWQPENRAIFLNWRLQGSLPEGWNQRQPIPDPKHRPNPGRDFRVVDGLLDAAGAGPVWLKDPAIADLVVDAFSHAERELRLYRLKAWVVMANHVHLLIEPSVPLARVTKVLKGYAARQANQLLGRTGETFWQDESYDHWVRNQQEHYRIASYIERNPVTAGLVEKPEDWPWSSARRGTDISVCPSAPASKT